MRTDAGGLVGQGTRWIIYLLASVLVMCLCSPACLVAAGNDVSAEIAVTPGSHNLAIPAIPDGSEMAEITVTITAATGWNLIRLDPAPAGWSGTYQRMYDGMSPGEAYGGVFTGELEPIEQLPPPKGSGGGKPDYTFTVNAEGTSIKPEYRIRPDEQTVCVGESATFYAEKKVDEASGWIPEESFWTVGGDTNYPVASSVTVITNTPGEYSVVAANSPTRVLSDSAELTVVQVDLVKAPVQAYTEPDIFPNVCRNAQDDYKMAKWKAVVKPAGTTANVYQWGGGWQAEIKLTAIGDADLTAMTDEQEFWVETIGQSGIYEIGIRHNDKYSCSVDKDGKVFSFDLKLEKDAENNESAQSPNPDAEILLSEANGAVSVANTGGLNIEEEIKGGRVILSYTLKAVADTTVVAGLNVKAKAKINYSSSGSVIIRNEPVTPSIKLPLSMNWGIISFDLGGGPLGTRGRAIGGAKLKGHIESSAYESPQLERSDSDVGVSIDIPIEESFPLSPTLGITDIARTYTIGTTEYAVKTRLDCASAVKQGSILGIPDISSSVLGNMQTIITPTVTELNGVFEIVQ